MKKAAEVVAEIALYGTSAVGAGWILALPDGRMFGNGEPVEGRSFTQAVWEAADLLRYEAGVRSGLVRIYAPGGERTAVVDVGGHIPWFGQLAWGRAPVWAASAEDIERAAAAQKGKS